jgi:four helix bundle protein
MTDRVLSHRDLKVWQKAVDFVDRVYDMTENFPKHEMYGLTSQVRRASVSVPSNIAEGNGRGTTQDYIRFLYQGYGSLMEVDTQVHIARRRNYITPNDESGLIEQLSEIGRMLNGLISSLERRKQQKVQTT